MKHKMQWLLPALLTLLALTGCSLARPEAGSGGDRFVGFYLVRENQLVLGPFQGRPACVRIDFGKGVCGTAAAAGVTQLVPNVHEFPGHIACDGASNSEIVIPMFHDGQLTAVLDIDSPVFHRFTETDRNGLERCAAVISKACCWQPALP